MALGHHRPHALVAPGGPIMVDYRLPPMQINPVLPPPTIISLATAWGPKFGGINAFNTELLKSIGMLRAIVAWQKTPHNCSRCLVSRIWCWLAGTLGSLKPALRPEDESTGKMHLVWKKSLVWLLNSKIENPENAFTLSASFGRKSSIDQRFSSSLLRRRPFQNPSERHCWAWTA